MDKTQGFYDYTLQASETSIPSNGLAFSWPQNTASVYSGWDGEERGDFSYQTYTHTWYCYTRDAWQYSYMLCVQSSYMPAGAEIAACTTHQE